MAKFCNRPLRRRMTLRTIFAEKSEVTVLRLVTRGAIQEQFLALQVRRNRGCILLFKPGCQFILNLIAFDRRLVLFQTNPRKSDVIHFRCGLDLALMFEMTHGALGDVRVKCSGLPLENGFVVRMADDAIFRLDALQRRVAGGAIVFKKGVRF